MDSRTMGGKMTTESGFGAGRLPVDNDDDGDDHGNSQEDDCEEPTQTHSVYTVLYGSI